jgi:ectoine hydroxylase-related dioxygenase (phytanoyl-CoA dioxygenase family)
MIERSRGYLKSRSADSAPAESIELEQQGFTVLRNVLNPEEVEQLAAEVSEVYEQYESDSQAVGRTAEDNEMFRYEMLNRSALCQKLVSNPLILDLIEPLLGQDCHVIANTAWRNPAGHPGSHGGQNWHIDAGPHIPLAEGTSWPVEIPHPVFAIGSHTYLKDCNLEDGPTGVIPGSHLSGRFPPNEQTMDDELEFEGQGVHPLIAKAGDVAFFVSDVWHRRMPTGENDNGRFFVQIHYGRRDIAQRILQTERCHQLSEAAKSRAITRREKTVVGLHQAFFYDG